MLEDINLLQGGEMKLLMIGGTRFVGRHMVEEALRRGHTVTLFNRGNAAEVFPGLEQLKGDRNTQLDALKGRTWDAVIDTCGYLPGQVEASAGLLKDAVSHYTFISTISVYEALLKPLQAEPIREASPLLKLLEPPESFM
jgi:2'-hydroxyisoflavone reductase